MIPNAEEVAARLVRLGFSQYEARTYVGLLATEAATGYTIANLTGVPQPKVYETLRRLVERGAAVQTDVRPARYAAVPPTVLLARLEDEFQDRLEAAREGLEHVPLLVGTDAPFPARSLDGFDAAAAAAATAIAGASERVYLHGRSDELRALSGAVHAASERDVEFVIVHFGPLPFARPRGQVRRHASTEGTLYASRKARHLAVVVDSRWSLWALARDGRTWTGVASETPLLAGLVKTYIRHDLFVQRIYADLPEELEARYGPGLLQLADLSRDQEEAEASEGAS